MNFNQFNLDARLQAGIKRAGYSTATPIQTQAIPAALDGKDLIGTAQTGTGKTAAFVLPILHTLLSGPRNRTRTLIVTPTRELAEQIHQTIHSLSVGTNLRSATIYGGVGSAPQIQALRKGVEIIVACPGRLLDLVAQGHANLSNIEILVLDEADRMFDMGFLPDVRRIIKAVPARRQTMLFSATFPREVEQLANQSLRQSAAHRSWPSAGRLTPSRMRFTRWHNISSAVCYWQLLKQTDTDSVLIFTRTKHRAARLQKQIKNEGYRVTSLHSDRTQGQRQTALNGFKNGQFQIMVATDIAARGLDVDSISHVINYDMPGTADAYIHRIGRTGRAERNGDAFTLVTPDDEGMIRTLEKIMGHKLERQKIHGFNYLAPTPPQVVSSPRKASISRKPKHPAAPPPRETESRRLRRQHAKAGDKSHKRY